MSFVNASTFARPATSPEYVRPLLAALLGEAIGQVPAGAVWPPQPVWSHGNAARLPAFLQRAANDGIGRLFDAYSGPLSFGRGVRDVRSVDIQAHPAALFSMGLTVHLHDAAAILPGAEDALRALENELQAPARSARVAVFASPAGDGLPLHFDGEDVISIQLVGRKRFEFAPVDGLRAPVGPQYGPGMMASDDLYPQCGAGFPGGEPVACDSVEMLPGSVLFIGRGTWHRTQAQEDSLAVSIVVRPPVAADAVLAQLRALLLQDARWRAPLYGARRASLPALLAELPAIAAQVEAGALEARLDGLRPELIAPGSRFQRVPSSSLELTRERGRLLLRVTALDADWTARVTLDRPVDAALEPALDWLAASCAAFRADDLAARFPALRFDDVRQLLRALSEVVFLRWLPFPALDPVRIDEP